MQNSSPFRATRFKFLLTFPPLLSRREDHSNPFSKFFPRSLSSTGGLSLFHLASFKNKTHILYSLYSMMRNVYCYSWVWKHWIRHWLYITRILDLLKAPLLLTHLCWSGKNSNQEDLGTFRICFPFLIPCPGISNWLIDFFLREHPVLLLTLQV